MRARRTRMTTQPMKNRPADAVRRHESRDGLPDTLVWLRVRRAGVVRVFRRLAATGSSSSGRGRRTGRPAAPRSIHLSQARDHGPKPRPITPPKPEEITAAIDRGIQFLLDDQRPDGSWGSPENTKASTSTPRRPAPTTPSAPASPASSSWRSSKPSRKLPTISGRRHRRPSIAASSGSIERVAATPPGHARRTLQHLGPCLCDPGPRPASQPCRRRSRSAGPAQETRRRLRPTCWAATASSAAAGPTTTCCRHANPRRLRVQLHHRHRLIALNEAEVDRRQVPRAAHSRRRSPRSSASRIPTSATPTANTCALMPMHPINRPGGSLGRSQVCNLALRLYGDERVTDDVLETWLDRLYRPQRLAQHGPQTAHPARIVLLRRRLLLLLRPLVRRPVHRPLPAAERPHFQDHLAHISCRSRKRTAAGGTTRSTTTTSNTAPRWPS